MTVQNIMQTIAPVRNALYGMTVCGEQTHIVSDCVRALDALLNELNRNAVNAEVGGQ